jgi:hypothetical protein
MFYSLFRSKKAMFNVLLVVIVTLVVGLLLMVIGYQAHIKLKSINDDEKCRLSLLGRHVAKQGEVAFMQGSFTSKVSLECERKFLRIKLGDVERYRRIDDDLLKTYLAEEMKSCWSKVGASKIDPFSKGTNAKYCLVCTDIVFDKDLVEQAERQDYELKGFQYWIASHKLPGLKTTLYEYVKGARPTPELLKALKETENHPASKFNLNEKYVAVWRVDVYKPDWWDKFTGAVIGGLAGIAAVAGILLSPVTGGLSLGVTLTVLAATTGSVVGAGVGVGVVKIAQDDTKVQQEVHVLTESQLSTNMDFDGDGKPDGDFCSRMFN